MSKNCCSIEVRGFPVLNEQDIYNVKLIDGRPHVTMSVYENKGFYTLLEGRTFLKVKGTIIISNNLYVLQGHYTKQTMIVCKVIPSEEDFKKFKGFVPEDTSPFERVYHVTVGTIPYDPEIENLSLYRRVEGCQSLNIDFIKYEAFNPVTY